MTDLTKPTDLDGRVWAESGTITSPDTLDILDGWDVGEKPPAQFFNYWQNRTDKFLSYLMQKGIPEWDINTLFIANKSFVTQNGNVYLAKQNHSGQNPALDITFVYWKLILGNTEVLYKPEVVTNVAALRLVSSVGVKNASTRGYYTAGDGGHGQYWYDSTDTTSADDGGSVIVGADGGRWKLQVSGRASVRQFGAKGDGVTVDTDAIKNAISYSNSIFVPAGIYIIDEEILITSPCMDILGEGQGYARNLVPYDPSILVDVSTLRFIGTGAKSIKTRYNYRGSALDAEDAPLSTAINIQADGVNISKIKIDLYCDYDDLSPTNYGDDWDVGIFHGSRQSPKLVDVNITGYWREASVWLDSTRMVNGSELNDYPYTFGAGADGITLENVQTIGGKWGIRKQGPNPKGGLIHFGFQYVRAGKFVFSGIPSNGDTLTVGSETYTFKTTAATRFDVQIGASISLTIDALILKLQLDRLVPYDALTFTKNGSSLEIYSTTSSATPLSESSASISVQTIAGGVATQTETIADPAQYYDNTDGLIDDGRNSLGASDTVLINCVICSVEHHSFYRKTDIAAPANLETDQAAGSLLIDGLGGNAVIHRFFSYGTRFQSVEPFNVLIKHGARIRFTDCTADSAATGWFSTSGGVLTSADTYGKYAASSTKAALLQISGYDDPGDYFPQGLNNNQIYSHFYLEANDLNLRRDAHIGGYSRVGEKNTGATTGYSEILSGNTANSEMRFGNEAYASVARLRSSPSGVFTIATRVSGTGTITDRLAFFDNGADFSVAPRPNVDNTLSSGTSSRRWGNVYATNIRVGGGTAIWTSGAGSPEGVISAVVGSMYTRTDGGADSTLYIKETGAGNTGWVTNANSKSVGNIAALRAVDSTVLSAAETQGYYTAGDGGAGSYWLDPSDTTSADNGFTVIVAADGGRWKLQPTSGKYFITQAGAIGDGVTDNKNAFSVINTSGESIVIPEGVFASTETFMFSGLGRSIEGIGQQKSILHADFVSGAALRLMSQYQSASNFSITGSSARYAAAYTSNGFGIHAECVDVVDDPNITRMRGLSLHNIDITNQTGAAVYVAGTVTDGGLLQSLRCFNNKGHGLAVDRGFLSGRINKSSFPTGVINVNNMLSFGNTGHAIALGHKDDTTTTQTVRVVIDNLDANVSSMDSAQLYSATYDHGVWIAGSNNELINSTISGNGTQVGAFVKGTNISIRNFRQVETAATLEVGDNVAGLPTRDITLDGVNVVNTAAQTNAVILSGATDIRDIDIRISNTADITNIVDTTTIRGLTLNNPTSFRRSAIDTVYNNTTTATAIDGLSYRAAANEAFRFRAGIFYSGDAAADLRLTVGSTASVTSIEFGSSSGIVVGSSLTATVIAAITALNTPISLGTDASKRYFEFSGYVVNGASAATITINAAQLSAVVADTVVYAGSNLTVERFVS